MRELASDLHVNTRQPYTSMTNGRVHDAQNVAAVQIVMHVNVMRQALRTCSLCKGHSCT